LEYATVSVRICGASDFEHAAITAAKPAIKRRQAVLLDVDAVIL